MSLCIHKVWRRGLGRPGALCPACGKRRVLPNSLRLGDGSAPGAKQKPDTAGVRRFQATSLELLNRKPRS